MIFQKFCYCTGLVRFRGNSDDFIFFDMNGQKNVVKFFALYEGVSVVYVCHYIFHDKLL